MYRTARVWVGVCLAVAVALPAARAATNFYYVSPTGGNTPPYGSWGDAATTIQAAVTEAEGDVGPGTECVVLVTAATYTVTSQIAISTNITLRSFSGSPADTIIKGGYPLSNNRCLYVEGAGAVVDGFTFTNGFADSTTPYGNRGGGIYVATGTVQNCTVVGNNSSNTSAQAAGVYVGGGGVVSNCFITRNAHRGATVGGGAGAYVAGGLLTDCVITTNTSHTLSGSHTVTVLSGGVVRRCTIAGQNYARNTVSIAAGGLVTDSVIASNLVANQPGILLASGGVISNTMIFAMSNTSSGAAITTSSGGLIYGCVISGCVSRVGVVYMNNGTLRNCLLVGNSVGGTGTVYMIDDGTVENCTITRNWAGGAAAGFYNSDNINGQVLINTIIYDNDAPVSNNYSIPTTGTIYNNCTDPILPGAGNTNTDPLFVSVGTGYGTNAALGNYRLQAGSPCIDTGSNQAWMAYSKDLDANPRIRPTGGLVDIGAFEAAAVGPLGCTFTATPTNGLAPLQATFTAVLDGDVTGASYQWVFGDGYTSNWSGNAVISHTYAAGIYSVTLNVTNAGSESASSTNLGYILSSPANLYVATNGAHVSPYDTWGRAATTIQAAVNLASPNVSTVWVSNGVYRLTEQVAVSNRAVTLRSVSGNPADVLLVGAHPAASNRCLWVSDAGAVVRGFTITNGYTSGTLNDGGGIYLAAGTIEDCVIIGNTAAAVSTRGGGVYAIGGTVRNCRILRNANYSTSTQHGGGGLYAAAALVENCEIERNYSILEGGGVDLRTTSILRGCLVAGNTAIRNGGGVYVPYNTGARQQIENCTIVANSATNGGGVYSAVVASTGVNCIVYFNRSTSGGVSNDLFDASFTFSCSPDLAEGAYGNRAGDPLFLTRGSGYGTNYVRGDYHVYGLSPAYDTAASLAWMAAAVDIEGHARVADAGPNMGAYEAEASFPGVLFLIQ